MHLVTAVERQQIEDVVRLVRNALDVSVLGIYLHGSATAGVLRTLSDLDILAVTSRQTTGGERAALVAGLLLHSGPYPPDGPMRPLELTVLALPDVKPWRYPPRTDFQYGEWRRADFERGEATPWAVENPDAAVLITAVRGNSEALFGPRASDLFDAVPRGDLMRANLESIPALLADLPWDTRNVLLTFARMWVTVATGELRPKDEAATWAMQRLPAHEATLLGRARDQYVEGVTGEWGPEALDLARTTVEAMAGEIRREAVAL